MLGMIRSFCYSTDVLAVTISADYNFETTAPNKNPKYIRCLTGTKVKVTVRNENDPSASLQTVILPVSNNMVIQPNIVSIIFGSDTDLTGVTVGF